MGKSITISSDSLHQIVSGLMFLGISKTIHPCTSYPLFNSMCPFKKGVYLSNSDSSVATSTEFAYGSIFHPLEPPLSPSSAASLSTNTGTCVTESFSISILQLLIYYWQI